MFVFSPIPTDQQTILGDGRDEIVGFEDFAVKFIESHLNKDYIFMVVDENLDVENDGPSKHEAISGSLCVENIRRRLSPDAERRVLALVRSANDSTNIFSFWIFIFFDCIKTQNNIVHLTVFVRHNQRNDALPIIGNTHL